MPRILCIMGSGETAPTMTSVHADLIANLPNENLASEMVSQYLTVKQRQIL